MLGEFRPFCFLPPAERSDARSRGERSAADLAVWHEKMVNVQELLDKLRENRLDRELMRHVRILEEDIARNDGRPVRLGDPASPLLLARR